MNFKGEIESSQNGLKPFKRSYNKLGMFKNNGPWDMQVGHGLPGQVIVRSKSGEVVPDKDEPGRYEKTDRLAVLNGNVHRAGYISN